MRPRVNVESSAQQLQQNMVALVRDFGLLEPDETPCGQPLGPSAAHALMELAGGTPLWQSELGACLRLEKSTVSRLVTHLERRGWIDRRPDPDDGRAFLVSLTEEGHAMAARVAKARGEKFAAIVAHVPPRERESLLRALHVLVEAVQATSRRSRE